VSLAYYLDDDSGMRAFLREAPRHGVTVARSDDVGLRGRTDPEHLEYAASQGLALVTANRRDFQRLHETWIEQGREHSGIFILDQRLSVGERIRILLFLAAVGERTDFANRFEFLDDWR
jgi:hypothetical protein